ncbi:class C sortase [Arcanobacterium phocae]|uniref:class C sortase n=1 Tax=Arcanobacterium phocae TaxID=131112 RepID=UPI001C0EE9C2|nr:class C sortase [Arcanobacterium phocae]
MSDIKKSPKHLKKSTWKFPKFALVPVVIGLAGIIVFTYPDMANWFSSVNQAGIVNNYSKEVQNVHPAAAEQLKLAHEYNDALTSGAILEKDTRIPSGDGTEDGSINPLDYQKLLNANDSGLMARVIVPKADIDLPVFHGTSEDVLLVAVGHLQGTSLPVGGNGTRTVLTGHRGLASAKIFTDLDKVTTGDEIIVEVFGETLDYRVTETKVVEPSETEEIRAVPGRDLITLVTCTPLGINSHRILVTGERVFPTPKAAVKTAEKESTLPHFPWWIFNIIGGLVISGIYIWRSGYPRRSKKKAAGKHKLISEATPGGVTA